MIELLKKKGGLDGFLSPKRNIIEFRPFLTAKKTVFVAIFAHQQLSFFKYSVIISTKERICLKFKNNLKLKIKSANKYFETYF